ncbi:MAG TPA: carbonic anhydrase family protein [Thermoanaerobaculia bacterium]|jgi:carbonic anhydrase
MTRRILTATALAALTVMAALHAQTAATASGPSAVQTQVTQAAMTPAKALALLKEGNAHFATGKNTPHDYPAQVHATAGGQYPFAAIVSCMDSRVTPEVTFDCGLGDIFGLREAGNVVDVDTLGGLEYATKVVGVKLILVVGHSHCGAIKGAVDGVQLGNLTELLKKIQPAMTQPVPAAKSKDDAYVQKVAEANVRLQIKEIQDKSPVIKELVQSGKVGIAGAMYDIETGKVTFLN